MNSFIDDEKNMELCPFGALMTLQYSLTAAPASQPMNAVLGQAISLAIAIGIGSISGLDLWLRQSLATALAIMTMAKLGLTHPPAGAAALIFAGGRNTVVGETMQ
jgi:CBS-domain-containing membrane protein